MRFKSDRQRKAVMAKLRSGYYRQNYGLNTDSSSMYARLRGEGKSDEEAQYQVYKSRGIIKDNKTKVTKVKDKPTGIKEFDKPVLTEREVNLLMRRINAGKIKPSDLSKIKRIYDGEGIPLTPEQSEKGRRYLYNLWKTPRGKERKNNPFGYREEDIIDNLREIRLRDVYSERGNFYVPLYEAISKQGNSMEYYVSGGKISIVG